MGTQQGDTMQEMTNSGFALLISILILIGCTQTITFFTHSAWTYQINDSERRLVIRFSAWGVLPFATVKLPTSDIRSIEVLQLNSTLAWLDCFGVDRKIACPIHFGTVLRLTVESAGFPSHFIISPDHPEEFARNLSRIEPDLNLDK
jgi:hypothetical protein